MDVKLGCSHGGRNIGCGCLRIFGPKGTMQKQNGENYIMRSLMICTPHPYCSGDKIEKNEMGGACSVYGGEEKCV